MNLCNKYHSHFKRCNPLVSDIIIIWPAAKTIIMIPPVLERSFRSPYCLKKNRHQIMYNKPLYVVNSTTTKNTLGFWYIFLPCLIHCWLRMQKTYYLCIVRLNRPSVLWKLQGKIFSLLIYTKRKVPLTSVKPFIGTKRLFRFFAYLFFKLRKRKPGSRDGKK